MSSKASASKKRSQQLKRNPKRKIDDEDVELPKKKVIKIIEFIILNFLSKNVICSI